MADFDIIACTDVTGYGLLGHLIGNCDSMSSVHPHPATETHLDAKKIMVMCASDRLGFGSIWISE
jgi:selenophosphate synthase